MSLILSDTCIASFVSCGSRSLSGLNSLAIPYLKVSSTNHVLVNFLQMLRSLVEKPYSLDPTGGG